MNDRALKWARGKPAGERGLFPRKPLGKFFLILAIAMVVGGSGLYFLHAPPSWLYICAGATAVFLVAYRLVEEIGFF